jgi:pilus assembly protein CpaB
MSRRLIAIGAALALALVGALLVVGYARGADARALQGQNPVTVYISTAIIPSGTSLAAAAADKLLVETQVAQKSAPTGALGQIDGTNGSLLAMSDIAPGEYLLADRFGTAPVGTKAIDVPNGMLAVSAELTDAARVGKFVTPGSHITIFDSYKIQMLGTDSKSKQINDLDVKGTHVLLDDALVIAVGDTALAGNAAQGTKAKDGSSNAASFLVTVAVTPAQATRLVHGINTGTLYAALRGTDSKVESGSTVSDLDLFSGRA